MGDVQLLAVHAQDAAVRVLAPTARAGATPVLTPREVEVLHWTMLGKDAAAIGQILSVSHYTVKFHLANVMEKLDAETKHLAVIRALQLGLLPPDSANA